MQSVSDYEGHPRLLRDPDEMIARFELDFYSRAHAFQQALAEMVAARIRQAVWEAAEMSPPQPSLSVTPWPVRFKRLVAFAIGLPILILGLFAVVDGPIPYPAFVDAGLIALHQRLDLVLTGIGGLAILLGTVARWWAARLVRRSAYLQPAGCRGVSWQVNNPSIEPMLIEAGSVRGKEN